MFNVKSFLFISVLLGAALLVYGVAFLSMRVVTPQADINEGQLMVAITEVLAVVILSVVAVFGGMYYFTKKQFGASSTQN